MEFFSGPIHDVRPFETSECDGTSFGRIKFHVTGTSQEGLSDYELMETLDWDKYQTFNMECM